MSLLPFSKNNRGFTPIILVVGVLVLALAGVLGYVFWSNTEKAPQESSYEAPETPVSEEGTITVWSWNIAAKALDSVAKDFKKLYPNVNVVVKELNYNDANGKFREAISTGTGFPDVWDTEGPVTYEYIKNGALMDLTDKAAKYKNDFVDYKWAEVMDGNKIYALPWDSAPAGIFYRRDLFKEAGVNPDNIVTWDDYIAAGKKVTKDKDGDGKPDQFMTLMSSKADVFETYLILVSQYGGTLFDKNGQPAFNSPESVKAIKLMKKIYDAGIGANIGWWTPEMFSGIKDGTIASLPQGVWMGGQIKSAAPDLSQKWGVMPLPAVVAGGARSAVRGGSNLAIPVKAKNKEMAWKFIEFALANKNSQVKMYKEYNIFPALKAAYSDPVFNEADIYYNNQKVSQLFVDFQKKINTNFYYGNFYNQSYQIASKEIVKVLAGELTPEQALNNTQKEVLSRMSTK